MRKLINKLDALWCRYMHTGITLPIHGQYECRRCLRKHQVAWAKKAA